MNVIHAFMLLLAIAGQPERAVMICDTYKKCADAGVQASVDGFSYRIIPIIIMPEAPTT